MTDLVDRAFEAWDKVPLPAPLAVTLGDFHGPWRGGGAGFSRGMRETCVRHLRAQILEQCGYDKLETADEVIDAMRVSDDALTSVLNHVLAIATGGTTNDETTWRSAIHAKPIAARSEW